MLEIEIEQTADANPIARHRVKGKRFLIGRHQMCDLRLESKTVSKTHCVIQRRGDQVLITDLGSRAGTKVNCTPLSLAEVAALQDGDCIQLGQCQFRLSVRDAETGRPSYCQSEYLGRLPYPFVQLADRRGNEPAVDAPVPQQDEASPTPENETDSTSKASQESSDTTVEIRAASETTAGDPEMIRSRAQRRYRSKTTGPRSAAKDALDKMFPGSNR